MSFAPPSRKSTAYSLDLNNGFRNNGKSATTLQDAFLKYKKFKQDGIELMRKDRLKKKSVVSEERMNDLRLKFIEQAKKYCGVPYAKRYCSPDSPEYNSPIFLDCCGLVRRVMYDLEKDFGFRIGPGNQAYMFDTLPKTVKNLKDVKPGDLVFISGIYYNDKMKKQRHNMTHVEIMLGDGEKTIGSRWNNGKVSIFDSYKFVANSFHSSVYYFKSIDTWLLGICRSFCPKHLWFYRRYMPTKKSIFSTLNDKKPKKKKSKKKKNGKKPKKLVPIEDIRKFIESNENRTKEVEIKEEEELTDDYQYGCPAQQQIYDVENGMRDRDDDEEDQYSCDEDEDDDDGEEGAAAEQEIDEDDEDDDDDDEDDYQQAVNKNMEQKMNSMIDDENRFVNYEYELLYEKFNTGLSLTNLYELEKEENFQVLSQIKNYALKRTNSLITLPCQYLTSETTKNLATRKEQKKTKK